MKRRNRISSSLTLGTIAATAFASYVAEAASGGTTPGTMPTPQPTCQPATCFRRAWGTSLQPNTPVAALAARSNTFVEAVVATGDPGIGGRFRSTSSSGLRVRTTAPGQEAMRVNSTSPTGPTIAVEARAHSSSAPAVILVGNGGGRLLSGRSGYPEVEVFRVANNGTITVGGQPILQQGPKGDPGAQGSVGNTGNPGNKGPTSGASTYPVCSVTDHCGTACSRGAASYSQVTNQSGCSMTTSAGSCGLLAGASGHCCECKR